jgi:hypothetical protein
MADQRPMASRALRVERHFPKWPEQMRADNHRLRIAVDSDEGARV